MSVKTVLFDLDGTLINSLPLIRLTFKKVFADFGIPWANGEVLKTIGLPLREVAEHYTPGRVEEFLEKYTEYQSTKHKEFTKLYPGTLETLAIIKTTGYRTGVVTSKRKESAAAGMTLTGLNGYVEIAVAVEDAAKPKPNPEPVLKALGLLSTQPEEAVYVGDSWYDVLAGKHAGVTTVGVTWGMATRDQLEEHSPDFIVDTWEEFLATLSGL